MINRRAGSWARALATLSKSSRLSMGELKETLIVATAEKCSVENATASTSTGLLVAKLCRLAMAEGTKRLPG